MHTGDMVTPDVQMSALVRYLSEELAYISKLVDLNVLEKVLF